jgi:hypothetical protein
MAIQFYNSGVSMRAEAQRALKTLRGFLNETEPQLVTFLHHIWNQQQRAITYKELREAIMIGYMDPSLIEEWTQDYSKFVTTSLLPLWLEAMESATKELHKEFPSYVFDSTLVCCPHKNRGSRQPGKFDNG